MNFTIKSKHALWICWASVLLIGFNAYPKWEKKRMEATISWDASGYYWYLPTFFIYKDVKKQLFAAQILQKYEPTPYSTQTLPHPKTGNQVMLYPMGMALAELPFFALAHLSAKALGYEKDGFSKPYQMAIGIGMLLWAIIGLAVLRKILIQFFTETNTAFAILLLYFGTNYLEYSTITNAMTHSFLFTLYAVLIFQTIKFHQKPTFQTAALIGLCIGWATLTRPTEIISALIPIFWQIYNYQSLKDRFLFLKIHFNKILFSILIAALLGSFQLFYWKYVTDTWIYNSYSGFTFDWGRPHVRDCLVSARAGWLTYTPLMLLSLLGFVPLFSKKQGSENWKLAKPMLFFSVLFSYICFSWSIWWYGGALGQRSMIQLYPILMFPMTAFLTSISRIFWKRLVLVAFLGMSVFHNVWLTYHAHFTNVVEFGNMTTPYFKRILWQWNPEIETKKLLDTRENFDGVPENPIILQNFDFNKYQNDSTFLTENGKKCLVLNEKNQKSPFFSLQIPNDAEKDGLYWGGRSWLRASVFARPQSYEWNPAVMPIIGMRLMNGDEVLKQNFYHIHRIFKFDNLTGKKITLDLPIPKNKKFTHVEVFFDNNQSLTTNWFDHLELIAF